MGILRAHPYGFGNIFPDRVGNTHYTKENGIIMRLDSIAFSRERLIGKGKGTHCTFLIPG